jgi:hypothetical protein
MVYLVSTNEVDNFILVETNIVCIEHLTSASHFFESEDQVSVSSCDSYALEWQLWQWSFICLLAWKRGMAEWCKDEAGDDPTQETGVREMKADSFGCVVVVGAKRIPSPLLSSV